MSVIYKLARNLVFSKFDGKLPIRAFCFIKPVNVSVIVDVEQQGHLQPLVPPDTKEFLTSNSLKNELGLNRVPIEKCG